MAHGRTAPLAPALQIFSTLRKWPELKPRPNGVAHIGYPGYFIPKDKVLESLDHLYDDIGVLLFSGLTTLTQAEQLTGLLAFANSRGGAGGLNARLRLSRVNPQRYRFDTFLEEEMVIHGDKSMEGRVRTSALVSRMKTIHKEYIVKKLRRKGIGRTPQGATVSVQERSTKFEGPEFTESTIRQLTNRQAFTPIEAYTARCQSSEKNELGFDTVFVDMRNGRYQGTLTTSFEATLVKQNMARSPLTSTDMPWASPKDKRRDDQVLTLNVEGGGHLKKENHVEDLYRLYTKRLLWPLWQIESELWAQQHNDYLRKRGQLNPIEQPEKLHPTPFEIWKSEQTHEHDETPKQTAAMQFNRRSSLFRLRLSAGEPEPGKVRTMEEIERADRIRKAGKAMPMDNYLYQLQKSRNKTQDDLLAEWQAQFTNEDNDGSEFTAEEAKAEAKRLRAIEKRP